MDEVLTKLESRKEVMEEPDQTRGSRDPLPRQEIFKRIEEDRERHKRLRERRWVQPISHNPLSLLPPTLAAFLPLADRHCARLCQRHERRVPGQDRLEEARTRDGHEAVPKYPHRASSRYTQCSSARPHTGVLLLRGRHRQASTVSRQASLPLTRPR